MIKRIIKIIARFLAKKKMIITLHEGDDIHLTVTKDTHRVIVVKG